MVEERVEVCGGFRKKGNDITMKEMVRVSEPGKQPVTDTKRLSEE